MEMIATPDWMEFFFKKPVLKHVQEQELERKRVEEPEFFEIIKEQHYMEKGKKIVLKFDN